KNGTMTAGSYFTPNGLSDTSWQVVALGDLDGDGDTDLLWRNAKTGALGAWLLDGTTQARSVALPAVSFPWGQPQDWEVRGLADFNGDGKPDIVWRNVYGAHLYVTFLNGTTPVSGTLTWPQRPSNTDFAWQIGAVADLNGDGKPDVVWNNRSTGALKVWFMNGTTGSSYGTTNPGTTGDPNWRVLGAADYNNDGKPDLFLVNSATQEMQVWLMNGVTRVSVLPLSPSRPNSMDWKLVGR
ncbi:MAG TPA: VCBS repeat-containing protein, partial [Coriobacteriia bacterium]